MLRTSDAGSNSNCSPSKRRWKPLVICPALAYVGVNVSPATLASPELLEILSNDCIPTARIVVEITERTSIQEFTALLRPRKQLRQLGILLAIDDAGSGYASFSELRRRAYVLGRPTTSPDDWQTWGTPMPTPTRLAVDGINLVEVDERNELQGPGPTRSDRVDLAGVDGPG